MHKKINKKVTAKKKPLPNKKRIEKLPSGYSVLVLPAKKFFETSNKPIGHSPIYDSNTRVSTIYLDKVPIASVMHKQKPGTVEISAIRSFKKINGRDAGELLEEAILQEAKIKGKKVIRTYREKRK